MKKIHLHIDLSLIALGLFLFPSTRYSLLDSELMNMHDKNILCNSCNSDNKYTDKHNKTISLVEVVNVHNTFVNDTT